MKNSKYNVVGLMSGTSLDGLDIAFCTFKLVNNKWKYSIKQAETIKYSKNFKEKISNTNQLNIENFLLMDIEFGKFLGKNVKKFIKKYKINPDFIASHGHTIFHQPDKLLTYQLGCGENIAVESGINVIYDFRKLDIAKGGQGAPLVPIGDSYLFNEYDYCINLGGFANLSFNHNNSRIAYDICPFNIVLNHLANYLGKNYDNNGYFASKGKCNENLLKKLDEIEYYHTNYPKSLGKEWVSENILPLLSKSGLTVLDQIRTFSEHIVNQILKSTLLENVSKKVLLTGGGTYNKFIVEMLIKKSDLEIVIPDKLLIEYKEAMIFAFLGVLRIRNEINCLSTVTGAISNSSSGKIIVI